MGPQLRSNIFIFVYPSERPEYTHTPSISGNRYNYQLTPARKGMFTLSEGKYDYFYLITGRNEVVAKVMFLHMSVILLTGGGSPETPPRTRENPPGPGRTPPTKENPPGTRENPPDQGEPPGPGRTPPGPGRTPPDQGEPPPTRENPPGTRENPPGKKTAAYGQWAAGTHPTGMHSCYGDLLGLIECLRLRPHPRYISLSDSVVSSLSFKYIDHVEDGDVQNDSKF